MVELDEARVAATALEAVWRQLASIVNEAKKLEAEAARDPSLIENPWVLIHARWVNLFKQDLAAVQTVYENLQQNGSQLSADDVRAAEEAAGKLLDFILKARERVREPQPV